MPKSTRREFFSRGGLAVVGVGTLTLRAGAVPTATSGHEDIPVPFDPQDREHRKLALTERDIEGPYFRAGAPFRAKVTPPLAAGRVSLIRGRVWGIDTKQPLPGATIHVWQASHAGRYDNDDVKRPPRKDVFKYRARMMTDELGRYEFETIHPGRYRVGETYRPAHIHYRIEAAGYKTLITQLYFKGDPFNSTDRFIKDSLIIAPKTIRIGGDRSYELGVFDIVLAKV